MARASLPFYVHATHAARAALGPNLQKAGLAAIKAVIKQNRSLEIACQQISYCGRHFALSTRISGSGELVVELDIGDPRLEKRIILEDDLRRTERQARTEAQSVIDARRRLNAKRW